MKWFKFLLIYLLPLSVWKSFHAEGLLSLLPLFLVFVLIPLLELMMRPDHVNMDAIQAEKEKRNSIYDWILYLSVPVQLGMLVYFFNIIQHTEYGSIEYFGRISAMGMMCGVMGINIGHELGHRKGRLEQFLGELLLLSSLNTHFLPYHNEGHHREVATPKDAATAKKGQNLFHFWISSHFGSYVKAWRIENKRMDKSGRSHMSIHNRMVIYTLANMFLLGSIYYFYGLTVLLAFVIASVIGILLLETVNYIEHYGLLREMNDKGRYERVKHVHSWNSDHVIGRVMLFNLSRHSDHHYKASKKYQVLESLPQSPQMPTGYPGMMLLALVPPLWFRFMHNYMDKIGVGAQTLK